MQTELILTVVGDDRPGMVQDAANCVREVAIALKASAGILPLISKLGKIDAAFYWSLPLIVVAKGVQISL